MTYVKFYFSMCLIKICRCFLSSSLRICLRSPHPSATPYIWRGSSKLSTTISPFLPRIPPETIETPSRFFFPRWSLEISSSLKIEEITPSRVAVISVLNISMPLFAAYSMAECVNESFPASTQSGFGVEDLMQSVLMTGIPGVAPMIMSAP